MRESLENTHASVPLLSCSTIVYRLLPKASWIDPDTEQVQPAAFQRRSDETGLSVFDKAVCSVEDAILISGLNKVKAVASLHVGRIRDLGLDVILDSDGTGHGEITGMPLDSEDPAAASNLAEMLAQQARIVWRRSVNS